MDCKYLLIMIWVLIASVLLVGISTGDDLDDGIAIDDEIGTSDSIKPDININFIKRKAKSRAAAKGRQGATSNSGDVVQGGIIVNEGSNIKGDIIVIFEGDRNTNINTK